MILGGIVLVLIDAHDEHWGIGGWGGDDDLLGASLQVSVGLVDGGEDSGGFNNVVGTFSSPWNGGGVLLVVDGDGVGGLAGELDNEFAIVGLDGSLELAVSGVVLEKVDHVLEVDEWVVDSNQFDGILLNDGTGDQATDAAESVDSDFRLGHFQ